MFFVEPCGPWSRCSKTNNQTDADEAGKTARVHIHPQIYSGFHVKALPTEPMFLQGFQLRFVRWSQSSWQLQTFSPCVVLLEQWRQFSDAQLSETLGSLPVESMDIFIIWFKNIISIMERVTILIGYLFMFVHADSSILFSCSSKVARGTPRGNWEL